MKCIIVITILAGLSLNANSQYGFVDATIFKKNGDSLNCQVQREFSYGDLITYRFSSGSQEKTIRAKQIKRIHTPAYIIENISMNGKDRLMTVVIEGKLGLYSYTVMEAGPKQVNNGVTSYGSKMKTTYALVKNGVSTELSEKNYREILGRLMDDCPSVRAFVEKSHSFDELQYIIESYNGCK
ncbi:MAG TPA: hypothetical protein VFX58_05770 [Chitinophagaceae bacterium]|nr:hypothetical protein [Chitinophagaceae bacterium]